MTTPPLLATIRLIDIKTAAIALSDGNTLPLRDAMNTLTHALGLGESFAQAMARAATAQGPLPSGHLTPLAPADPTTSPRVLLAHPDGRFLIGRENTLDSLLRDHPGYARAPLTATFEPQAWVRDCATPIDTDDETTFDASDIILSKTLEAVDEQGFDMAFDYGDDLITSVRAPVWMRDHNGPFSCTIDEFTLDELLEAHRKGLVTRLD